MEMTTIIAALNDNGIRVNTRTVNKNGVSKVGYELRGVNSTVNIAPTVYDDFFEQFKEISEVIDACIDILKETEKMGDFNVSNFTKEKIMNNSLLRIRKRVNNGNARKYVADLQTEVYIPVGDMPNGAGTITITNDHIKSLGLDKEKLFKAAAERTKETLFAQGMSQMMIKMMGGDFLDMFGMGMPSSLKDEEMIVVGNKEKMNGAIVLAFPDFFADLAKKIGKDRFYILPSSIHECLVINTGAFIGDLVDMVKEVNNTEVAPEEILSYNVYVYDATTNTVSVAN